MTYRRLNVGGFGMLTFVSWERVIRTRFKERRVWDDRFCSLGREGGLGGKRWMLTVPEKVGGDTRATL